MRPAPCVVSVAEHTGWAHLVCVAARGNVPAVIDLRDWRLTIQHGYRFAISDRAEVLAEAGL